MQVDLRSSAQGLCDFNDAMPLDIKFSKDAGITACPIAAMHIRGTSVKRQLVHLALTRDGDLMVIGARVYRMSVR